jgi:membrane-bound lytic murein transglycosylase D
MRELNPQFIRMVTPPRQTSIVRLPAGTGEQVVLRLASLEPKDRVSYVDHTVTRGQTLASIAKMYRVSSRLIVDANPGVRLTRLRGGTHLVIPTSFVPTVVEPAAPTVTAGSGGGATGSTTIRYRVRSGESLSTVAARYGTSVDRLQSLNALAGGEVLRAGQVIRVPAPTAPAPNQGGVSALSADRRHIVQRGETLSGIATKYWVALEALRTANGLTASSVLKAGTRLTIPE